MKKTKTSKKLKRKIYSNQAGITLIALVVTIVVLLILAGVSVNALFGNSGIIEKAKESQSAMTKAEENDKISLALTEWEIVRVTENKTFVKFMKEKFGEDNVTEVNENEVIVTMESGNRYRVTTDGTITSTKGISINKSKVTLKLKDGTTVTETLTATLSEITGEITWSNSDNTKATISATTGENITVTAKAIGTTTITATCGDYIATCTITVTKPVSVNKGAFVEYDVAYTDAYKGYDYTTKNGWRLLDCTDNNDGTYSNVKLISTGIPARLYYSSGTSTQNNSWYVTDETQLTNFRNVLTNSGTEDYAFFTSTNTYYGLQAAAGMYYNFRNIKFAYGTSSIGDNLGYFTKITSNRTTYDSTNTTETTGDKLFIPIGMNASVRLLTLPEVNKILGRTDIDSEDKIATEPTGMDGIFILQNIKNITGMASYTYDQGYYWLASPCPSTSAVNENDTFFIGYNGFASGYDSNMERFGVRPLISLQSNVTFVDENGDGVPEIQQ